MKMLNVILGASFLGMAMFTLLGYESSKITMFFAYLTGACLFFGKGNEGVAK